MDQRRIRIQLNEMAEEKYRIFTASLTPGIDNILGVRLPLLRKMAKAIVKDDDWAYLKEASDDTFEEVMLQGMVIGYCKTGLEDRLKLISDFVPKINNWAICDSFCNGLKITKEYMEQMWDFIQQYLYSNKEYEIRFGVVMILNYYILPDYALRAFAHFDHIKQDGYYVKMAVAWAVSIYYIEYPDITIDYLKNNQLDDFTYNKALQKITESLRIEKDTKVLIRSMKRK